MDMGMPFGIITEGLYGHHRNTDTIFQAKDSAQEIEQAVCRTLCRI